MSDIEYYLAPGWEDTFRPRIQELFDRIEELELQQHENQQNWQKHDKAMQLRIKELEAENKRLFDAHSVEMVRADKLQQEVKRSASVTFWQCPEWMKEEKSDE